VPASEAGIAASATYKPLLGHNFDRTSIWWAQRDSEGSNTCTSEEFVAKSIPTQKPRRDKGRAMSRGGEPSRLAGRGLGGGRPLAACLAGGSGKEAHLFPSQREISPVGAVAAEAVKRAGISVFIVVEKLFNLLYRSNEVN